MGGGDHFSLRENLSKIFFLALPFLFSLGEGGASIRCTRRIGEWINKWRGEGIFVKSMSLDSINYFVGKIRFRRILFSPDIIVYLNSVVSSVSCSWTSMYISIHGRIAYNIALPLQEIFTGNRDRDLCEKWPESRMDRRQILSSFNNPPLGGELRQPPRRPSPSSSSSLLLLLLLFNSRRLIARESFFFYKGRK